MANREEKDDKDGKKNPHEHKYLKADLDVINPNKPHHHMEHLNRADFEKGHGSYEKMDLDAPVFDTLKFSEETIEKAQKMSYFVVDPPKTPGQAITNGQYNVVKGVFSGATMFVIAPWVAAGEEMEDSEDKSFGGQTTAFFNGFGRGVVRGFAGITTIPIAGSITAANQFYVGIYKAPPNPGHGENSSENWEHIVYSKYLDLALNKEPFEDVDELGTDKKNNPRFKRDLDKFIKAGLIPAKKFDCNEVEVPYTYQFFVTDEPADFIDGFGMGQYNVGKGFIAGCVLAASAPIVDTMDSYSFNLKKQEKDQNDANDEIVAATGIEEYRKDIEVSQLQAVEAATAGFGKGVVRGLVGGVVLTFAGLTYGVISLAKGLFSIKNIPLCYKFTGDCMRDYERLKGDPIQSFVLQKEYGLEEFIVKEEARLEKAAEDLRLGEEKRIANLIAKDPQWYGEFPDSEELQPKEFNWDRYDYIERITRKRESAAEESGAIEEGEPEDKENA